MSYEFETLPEEEPRPSRWRSCGFTLIALALIVSLLGSSLLAFYLLVVERTSLTSTAVSPAAAQQQPTELAATDPTDAAPTPPTAVTEPLAATESPAASAASAADRLDRIAFINPAGQLVTIAPDGRDARILSDTGARFQFPAWAPTDNRIAAIGGSRGGSGVFVVTDEPAAAPPLELYASANQTPIYLYWAPDGQALSFLANDRRETLALYLVDTAGEGAGQRLAGGSPFYWHWTADSREMLVHVGFAGDAARMALIDRNGRERVPLGSAPGFFQSPAISADGRFWSYAQMQAGGVSWLIVDNREADETYTQRHAGAIAFSWSPTANQLAYISGEPDSYRFWGPLRLRDADTGEERLLSDEFVLAFFWSPDGQKIAVISAELDGAGGVEALLPGDAKAAWRVAKPTQQMFAHRFRLSVINPRTGEGLRLASFTPSTLFINQFLPFFDQYAHSHRLWSPDSSALVLPVVEDRVTKIMVAPVGGGRMREIARGDMPFWSRQ